jgi:hypothetical protein
MTYNEAYLQALSEAAGRVVIEWNRIELGCVGLAQRLAACLNPFTIYDKHQVLYIALLSMDLRQRVLTIKAYAELCEIEASLRDAIEEFVNRLDSDLRNRRNRFVHGIWACDFGQPALVRMVPQVKRTPPSGDRKLVLSHADHYGSIDEIAEFGKELTRVYSELSALDSRICAADSLKQACSTAITRSDGDRQHRSAS